MFRHLLLCIRMIAGAHTNNHIMKYADDTVILSLLHIDLSSYHSEIDTFIRWCDKNGLVFNVKRHKKCI